MRLQTCSPRRMASTRGLSMSSMGSAPPPGAARTRSASTGTSGLRCCPSMRSRPLTLASNRLTASFVKAMLLWMRFTCSANSRCNSAASFWLSVLSRLTALRRSSVSLSSWACNARSLSALHFAMSSVRTRTSSVRFSFSSASSSRILVCRRSRAVAFSASAARRSARAAAGSSVSAPPEPAPAKPAVLLLTRCKMLSAMSVAKRCSSPKCASSGPTALLVRSAVLVVEAGETSVERRRECSKDFCCNLASMWSVSRRKISRKSCIDIAACSFECKGRGLARR
mmetsp:Transcript_50150/g.149752  ORF Transcript_50150/g.149752 Transcript_50150/m.149752 type:complete len:283 (-) Transcript_50150:15-863(-)